MNKEIKEILEYVLSLTYGNENAIKGVDKVVDYITNLEQENKKLKELCDKYEEEHSTAFNLWTMKMKEMPDYEEKMNYKSRIDKAIEYIKNDWYELNTRDIEHCINLNKDIRIDLLNILQGSE